MRINLQVFLSRVSSAARPRHQTLRAFMHLQKKYVMKCGGVAGSRARALAKNKGLTRLFIR